MTAVSAVALAIFVLVHILARQTPHSGRGIILNVLKEELPAERKSRFLPFLAGLGGYAALLTLVR